MTHKLEYGVLKTSGGEEYTTSCPICNKSLANFYDPWDQRDRTFPELPGPCEEEGMDWVQRWEAMRAERDSATRWATEYFRDWERALYERDEARRYARALLRLAKAYEQPEQDHAAWVGERNMDVYRAKKALPPELRKEIDS